MTLKRVRNLTVGIDGKKNFPQTSHLNLTHKELQLPVIPRDIRGKGDTRSPMNIQVLLLTKQWG